MKLELFEIIFNNVNDVHYSGDRVTGEVFIQLKAPLEVQAIYIDFKGKAKCGWTKSSDDNEKKYKAEEIYFGKRVQLVGTSNGRTTEVCAGRHHYSFSMLLPPNLPSSFESKKGYVRYFCKVTIERLLKFSKTTKRPFTVIHHLDLNSVRNAAVPLICEDDLIAESCFCATGLVVGKFMLNKTGYVPGEPIVYNIDVCNRSTSTINRLDLELRQFVTYTGYSNSIFSNGSPKQLTKMKEFTLLSHPCRIKRGMEEHLNRGAIIPALPPSGLDGCGIINIEYVIALSVNIGWNMYILSICHKIVIGTIPTGHRGDAAVRNGPSTSSLTASMAPPPYTEPPPSYEESVFGRVAIQDEDEDEEDAGDASTWAPSYPYYNWDQPPPTPPLGVPVTSQPRPSSPHPTEPPPSYNQI